MTTSDGNTRLIPSALRTPISEPGAKPALTVTRVAHACVLLDFAGQAVLTDPWFSEKPGYHQGEPLGIQLADLPRLAGALVSHNHYDHYDMAAFRAYRDKSVPMIVKRGTAEVARKAGFTDVTEIDPWETASLGKVSVTATPAKHGVPENSYILQGNGATVYFGADTLLIPELGEIAPRFPSIDLALLAINGLKIRPQLNRKVVMDPWDAAELCAILRPRVVVPMHYAFTGGPVSDHLLLKYAGTPSQVLDIFRAEVARRAPETRVEILAPGEPLAISTLVPAGSVA